ncbi:carboxymuconolactone decarboxylase family protein [Streptomyces sp. SID8379]|uniref:carboxymuconolactone decarboxylase family protein n=1 Tax=unclassified Streptomyces TaxID=2593676 RepID=UPI00037AAEAD|nr:MULTISPECIES: carboxymuconolactone decarboxylase family protein [unclassified Streptomyces]MYW62916.1 carboxymuconolactone decarboxylase family protein [Streptomyces sp. SID8379]
MSASAAARDRRVFVDKQSPEAYHALVETAEAVRATAADAGLDRRLVELVNLRVSQLNGCAYCLNVHTRAALRAGETTQRLGVLAAWRDTAVFTERERAALALAEATTAPADAALQSDAYDDARAHFTDAEISAVIWVAITINAFNRVSILSKHPVRADRSGGPLPSGSRELGKQREGL